jgi:histidinol-phosphate aminotransferase
MTDHDLVSALVSDAVRALKPYEAGKPAEEVERELGVKNALKLASNENAYGPPPAALEAAKSALAHLELYPDAANYKLRSALANRHAMPMSQVVMGNGSNELIGMIARVFIGDGEHALSSAGSFIAYRIAARSHGRDFVEAALGADFGYDVDALVARSNDKTRVVYVANPNNPTGSHLGLAALTRLVEGLEGSAGPKGPPILVLDEAYLEYVDEDEVGANARQSSISIFERYPRTIILRTFSKAYGLAALRVGYALCRPQIADFLNRVRDPFNINTVGQVAAIAALSEERWVESTTCAVIGERKRVAAALRRFGFEPLPSQCNFLLVDVGRDARALNDGLMRRGVIARPMGAAGLPRHLRITIGRPQDNDRMLLALEAAIG